MQMSIVDKAVSKVMLGYQTTKSEFKQAADDTPWAEAFFMSPQDLIDEFFMINSDLYQRIKLMMEEENERKR